jgi:putative Holliday junction resolvase
MGRVLGLDFGTRRVGAALSDPRRQIATPLEVHQRRDLAGDLRHYQELVRAHEVDQIVIGLPLHTSGQPGTLVALARRFGARLAELTGLPIVFHDERFTTIEAENTLIAAGLKRRRRKGLRDMVAAQVLLQSYLDVGCPATEAPARPLDDQDNDKDEDDAS